MFYINVFVLLYLPFVTSGVEDTEPDFTLFTCQEEKNVVLVLYVFYLCPRVCILFVYLLLFGLLFCLLYCGYHDIILKYHNIVSILPSVTSIKYLLLGRVVLYLLHNLSILSKSLLE